MAIGKIKELMVAARLTQSTLEGQWTNAARRAGPEQAAVALPPRLLENDLFIERSSTVRLRLTVGRPRRWGADGPGRQRPAGPAAAAQGTGGELDRPDVRKCWRCCASPAHRRDLGIET
jgi:hypothetical protein